MEIKNVIITILIAIITAIATSRYCMYWYIKTIERDRKAFLEEVKTITTNVIREHLNTNL